jgi:hypothetical protein
MTDGSLCVLSLTDGALLAAATLGRITPEDIAVIQYRFSAGTASVPGTAVPPPAGVVPGMGLAAVAAVAGLRAQAFREWKGQGYRDPRGWSSGFFIYIYDSF